jgi:hypothetical protein
VAQWSLLHPGFTTLGATWRTDEREGSGHLGVHVSGLRLLGGMQQAGSIIAVAPAFLGSDSELRERVSREFFTVCVLASAPASSRIVRPLRCQQKRPHAISAGCFYGFTLTAPRTANVRTRSPPAGGEGSEEVACRVHTVHGLYYSTPRAHVTMCVDG